MISKIGFLVKSGFKTPPLETEYISDESLHTCSLDEPKGNQYSLKAKAKMFYHKKLLKIISFTVPLLSNSELNM